MQTICNNCHYEDDNEWTICPQCGDYQLPDINTIKDQGEARQLAIDWQVYAGEASLYQSEVIEAAGYFTELATKFDLTEEFQENGII